jgi:hypothetical protein
MLALLLALASASNGPVAAAPRQQVQTKLDGLDQGEARALLARLQAAQADVRTGKRLTFELLSGAPVSYPAVQVPPRRAFLAMRFDHPWSIQRLAKTGAWQPYELRYFPPGPNRLMWKVTVVLGVAGEIERLEMLYTAPPPF